MNQVSPNSTEAALQHPRSFRRTEGRCVSPTLSREIKLAILREWELDARRLLASESEGFCGGGEHAWTSRGRNRSRSETSLRVHQRFEMMPTLERQHCPQVVGTPDHALGHDEDDLCLYRLWFQCLQLHVQSVDYVGARPFFAEDVVTFGTFSAFTIGREATEKEQWRHIWSRIDGSAGASTICGHHLR